jgi:hypothetical protein
MFIEKGFRGTEGTERPGVFPRQARAVLPNDMLLDMWFDERGLATFTYEAISNIIEACGVRFLDQDEFDLTLPYPPN